MADPDLELRGGGGDFNLLALLAFLPSTISSFFTQNKGPGAPGLSPTSATKEGHLFSHRSFFRSQTLSLKVKRIQFVQCDKTLAKAFF